MSSSPARFIFIIGASGSGTTMLSRMLSRPACCASLGGNYISLPTDNPVARALVDRFNALTQDLWDRHADASVVVAAKRELPTLHRELLALPEMRAVTHINYKRSAPFMLGDRHRPDLADLFDLFEDVRIIAAYRDPRASAASSLRRGFAPSLRQCAVITDEQLTYISAQLATLDADRYLALGYEHFCDAPHDWTARLAALTGLDEHALAQAMSEERIAPGRNDRWRQELAPDDAATLDEFFNARRRRQWPMLERTALPALRDQPAGV
jgi:hypothetical protein